MTDAPLGATSGGGSPDARRVTLRSVTHRFDGRGGDVLALDGIDLDIAPGELVTVVGPSGCGKTTLLQLVAGFLRPSHGEVLVGGRPVTGPGPDRGVVFQHPNLFPWLSVRANVELGLRLAGRPKGERREVADRYLELVGLADFADAAPYELSGGMQQRCQIARALAIDASILLLDEPFGALDAITRDRLQDELRRIWEQTGKTAIFITHSVEEAVYLGTRVLVLSARPGRVVLDLPVPFADEPHSPELRTSPELVDLRRQVSEHLLHGAS